LRRAILNLAIGLVCGAALAAAQPRRPAAAGRHAAPKGRMAEMAGEPKSAAQPGPGFDATDLGSPLLLDEGWRVGISSDPAVAQPDFDDSRWAVRDATQSIESVNEPGDSNAQATRRVEPPPPPGWEGTPRTAPPGRRFAWFRLHIKLPPHHGPLALLIELPVSQNTSLNLSSTGWGVDVYANGREIQPEGPHGANPRHYQQISRIYDLGVKADDTSLVLVLRTLYIPLGFDSYTNFFASRTLRLGYRADLENALSMWSARELFERLPRLVISILLLILAIFLLVLYFTQRDRPEYLWLALHELMQAPIGFVELAGSFAYLDTLWYGAIVLQLVLVSAYLYFEFLVAFLSLRRRWYSQALRYTAPVLALQGPLLLLVGHSTGVGVALALVSLASILWIIGWTLFIFITLIAATVKRNYEAGLLLLALVLTMVGMAEPMVTMAASEWLDRPIQSPLTLQAGPIPIQFAVIADFIGIVVIVVIIFMRFLKVQADQEHSRSEMAAARSVQELMIPQQKVETPGFEVDSAYVPAQEVGGDFFHVQATDDGGLLVVIGDVAGKGLTAAMNVSMLMGALRQSRERRPARILNALNRVLVGSESYTTCQAAWFSADGELTVANAGHLPPYLNSQEVAIPGGLPLGVLQDGEYPETRLYLHPGDRILMCSDGVVEARGPAGELFGFERVHNLSNQSAFYVAEAAKDFGQEDDITVLTVRRAPVAAPMPVMAGAVG
jgi:hypothetical protein